MTEREDVEAACRKSIELLNCGYLDLYLVHWCNVPYDLPNAEIKPIPMEKTWKDMESLVHKGLSKSIGVSNCPIVMLINVIAGAEIPPAVNQVEVHPYFVRKPFVDFHKKFNVAITGYAPLAAPAFDRKAENMRHYRLLEEPVLKEIAEKHNRSVA